MAPPRDDASDYSDEEVATVLLALPDGPMEDAPAHTSSYIGGYPAFPAVPAGPSKNPKGKGKAVAATSAPEEVRCGACHKAMPLLSQVYCPLEGGENDRTVYVWACARPGCRRREGSVRAFRASVRNEEYVADVEAKRAEAERIAAEERERARQNPFTVKENAGPGLFGGSQPLFGAAAANPFAAPSPTPASSSSQPPASPKKEEVPTAAVASLSLSDPVTYAPPLPAYQPPQYITTMDEYLPIPEEDSDVDVDSDEDEAPEQKAEWREGGWDKLLPKSVDDIFERFARRLASAEDASNQVLRYDFNAMPLPYSSSSPLFKKLFPGAPTRAPSSEEDEVFLADYYTTNPVPACTRCGAARVFELQLVPQLINVLRPSSLSTTGKANTDEGKKQTEEERRAEIIRLAKGEARGDGEAGEMEWGTIMVFGCSGDCIGVGEEWVGVEWEAAPEA
jgi:pre-rRNA-processing protein TSR4